MIDNIRMDPVYGEDWTITSGRNNIYLYTAIDLYINDYSKYKNFSKTECMKTIMKVAKGSLNPTVVSDAINLKFNKK